MKRKPAKQKLSSVRSGRACDDPADADADVPTIPDMTGLPTRWLPVEKWPDVTPLQLANLAAKLDGDPKRALELLWNCALELHELGWKLENDRSYLKLKEYRHQEIVACLGFDPNEETYPMPRKRFLSRMRISSKELTLNGERTRGKDVWDAFVAEQVESVAVESEAGGLEELLGDAGKLSRSMVIHFGTLFHEWLGETKRRNLAKGLAAAKRSWDTKK
ncbi:MAG: hypothetical protein KDN22_29220 [Verrucomicrobiae bacterium]|nr:hypothetical protein [Verrucomicrobiae bacterium]